MPYSNKNADLALAGIIHFLHNNISKTRLRQRLKCLDYEAACSINSNGNSILHDLILLAGNEPSKCCSIMDALQDQMLTIDLPRDNDHFLSATSFLITHKNINGLAPFYAALKNDAAEEVIQRCSQWLNDGKKVGLIAPVEYVNVHFYLTEQAGACLNLFSQGGSALELQRCFTELNRAITHRHITPAFFECLLLSPNHENNHFVDLALNSQCSDTIKVVLNNAIINILTSNHTGNTAIHKMARYDKARNLQMFFNTFFDAHKNNELPDELSRTFISTAFLKPNSDGYRLLDMALIAHNSVALTQVVLNSAKLAVEARLLTQSQYRDVIITHSLEHHSPLHEVLLTNCSRRFSAYINILLHAVNDQIISTRDIQALFLQPNNCKKHLNGVGYSPMHQAINSGSLEIAEQFIHVFRTFFSELDYLHALSLNIPNGIKPYCQSHKPEAKYINAFVTAERRRQHIQTSPKKAKYAHFPRLLTPTYKSQINELCELTQGIERPSTRAMQQPHCPQIPQVYAGPGLFAYRHNQHITILQPVNYFPSFY